jgi:hypothetical protein
LKDFCKLRYQLIEIKTDVVPEGDGATSSLMRVDNKVFVNLKSA